MTFHTTRPPLATLGCGTLVLRLLAPLLLACTWLAIPPDARADGCEGCPAPTLEDLQRVPGFRLENRTDDDGDVWPDYYLLDKGECQATLQGVPDLTIEDAWLVLRATGEVWNCPHSKSTDTITVESAASDSTEWSFSVTLGAELGPVGAVFKREVEMGRTTGTTVTEVTTVSTTITPTFCHRVTWKAYFQVAKVKATGMFSFSQRWAWWTKNFSTGSSQVHAKGDITMQCGSGELELTRKAPISGHFDLSQRGCDGTECGYVIEKRLGMFPPWTPPLPPGGDAGEDEEEDETPATDTDPAASAGDVPTTDEPAPDDEPAGPQSSADLGDPPAGVGNDPLDAP